MEALSLPAQVSTLFVLLVCTLIMTSSASKPRGIRVNLSNVDSNGNFTMLEFLERAVERSRHRLSRLTSMGTPTTGLKDGGQVSVLNKDGGAYLIDLAIGTPPLPFPAFLDTGGDLTWTQCQPCTACYKQEQPIFDPSGSSTFSYIPCSHELCQKLQGSTCNETCRYNFDLIELPTSEGFLGSETFTFGKSNGFSVPHIVFGCSNSNGGSALPHASGVAGLGRGPLSLISQMGFTKFSYCLSSSGESTSPLFLGSSAKLNGPARTIKLLQNPSESSLYYLSLKGITVGATRIEGRSTTFAESESGDGFIIDTTTTVSMLNVDYYDPVRSAFVSQVKLPVVEDEDDLLRTLCFAAPSGASLGSLDIPSLIFHFEDGDMPLPLENYMLLDQGTGLLCLTIVQSQIPALSALGTLQQQNMHILYDLKNDRLSFESSQCDKL